MAVKDSNEIATNSNYALGDYSFRIERSSVPGSTNDKIEAICTKDGKNARKSIQVPSSTQIEGWYVETNETEATVYAIEKIPTGGGKQSSLDTSPVIQPIPYSDGIASYTFSWESGSEIVQSTTTGIMAGAKGLLICVPDSHHVGIILACAEPSTGTKTTGSNPPETINTYQSYTYSGKTVYYYFSGSTVSFGKVTPNTAFVPNNHRGVPDATIAWTLVYGENSGGEYETKEIIVGRFAIDLEDAGGVGPGSDWIDPGDYDPDWEPDDPTHTLYVEVTGALSGRHNDPIVDPSYSYIPADKDTVKDYGCGGDGGHGGGGGAGASTVVVHKFATNQANSKEVTAIARRHGYGSGGGKGGKGGDGCILVYY